MQVHATLNIMIMRVVAMDVEITVWKQYATSTLPFQAV